MYVLCCCSCVHLHVDVKVDCALYGSDKVVGVAPLCCFMEALWWCVFHKLIHSESC